MHEDANNGITKNGRTLCARSLGSIGWTEEELNYHTWRKDKSKQAKEAYMARLFEAKKQIEAAGMLCSYRDIAKVLLVSYQIMYTWEIKVSALESKKSYTLKVLIERLNVRLLFLVIIEYLSWH